MMSLFLEKSLARLARRRPYLVYMPILRAPERRLVFNYGATVPRENLLRLFKAPSLKPQTCWPKLNGGSVRGGKASSVFSCETVRPPVGKGKGKSAAPGGPDG